MGEAEGRLLWTNDLRSALFLVAFAVTLLIALLIDPNATTLHSLYRYRLSKAFLFNPSKHDKKKHGELEGHRPKLHDINTDVCPYPIINAALNLEGSYYANRRGRDADFFVFTPEYTGSLATGYVGSYNIEKTDTQLDLGSAMAISGAAVSPNMGSSTIRPLAFTLAFLNIRLGYWLRNPKFVSERKKDAVVAFLHNRSLSLFSKRCSVGSTRIAAPFT